MNRMNTTTEQKITSKEKAQVRLPFYIGFVLINVYLYNKYGINGVLLLVGALLTLVGFLRGLFLVLSKTLSDKYKQ